MKDTKNILNYEEIGKLFKSLATTSGLDIALYDKEGKELFCVRKDNCICNFIKSKECKDKIIYSGKKATELKSSYVYDTPCGLIMCISSVEFDKETIAYITCGPVRLWDKDEYSIEDLKNKCLKLGFNIKSRNYSIDNIKQISCEYMSGLSNILSIIVEYIVKEEDKYIKRLNELERNSLEEIARKTFSLTNKYRINKYPIELEKELIAYVQLGDKIKAKAIINSFLNEIFSYASGDLKIIKIKLYEFIAFLSRASVESGCSLESIEDIVKKTSKILLDNIDFVSLCEITIEVLDDFIDIVYKSRKKKSGSEYLAKAIKIINEEYYKPLSLEILSKEVFVSTYYISHMFRNEMGITFSDYLIKVRIENAKAYLKENYSIEDVCEKVGFNDSIYFIKTFKKYVGITPAKYKKLSL